MAWPNDYPESQSRKGIGGEILEQITEQQQAIARQNLQNGARQAVGFINALPDVELVAALSHIVSEVRQRMSSRTGGDAILHLVDDNAQPVADIVTPQQRLSVANLLLAEVNKSLQRPRPTAVKGFEWGEVTDLAAP
jgi:hypothetical protein